MNTLFHLNTPTPLLLCFDLKVNKNIKHLRDCKRELFAPTFTLLVSAKFGFVFLKILWDETFETY